MNLMNVIFHFVIGAAGAGTARCVLGMCPHWHHRIMAGGTLLALEAVVSVQLIG